MCEYVVHSEVMNERMPEMQQGVPAEVSAVSHEGVPSSKKRAESYFTVCKSLRNRLEVLDEAFSEYPMVTFPNGETSVPETDAERVVAKIQRLKDAIDGMLEQNVDTGGVQEAYVEEALRLSRAGVEHLEGFLAVQADLVQNAKAKGNEGARELADVLDTVAHTLLTTYTKSAKDEV